MTAKEYLSQYRTLNARIDAKLAQVQRLRHLAQSPGGQNYCGSFRRTHPRDKVGELTVKIVDLETEIDKLIDLEWEIKACISKLENENQRTVLEMRYINGFTFETIARKTHYSLRAVYYYHSSGLKSLQFLQ